MNKLSKEKRAKVLHLLCEGNSIRAVTRLTGVHKTTILSLLVSAGQACWAYQDKVFKNLSCKRIQVDEIWSFVYAKQKNVPQNKLGEAGDCWTWVAICPETKLVMSWMVGSRDVECGKIFMKDLAGRLANRVQLTSDGWRAYLEAVEGAFGNDIDFSTLVKIYGQKPEDKKSKVAYCIGAEKRRVIGNPNPKHISTSLVERQNLTMRMHMRRFTRLTNAFSKKVENHAYSVALHFMYYNFVKVHKTLRMTPAMAIGVADKIWDIEDIVEILEKWEKSN